MSTTPPAAGTTTVALIEDQQVLAGAIQRSLATLPDLRVVGAAASLAEGLALPALTRRATSQRDTDALSRRELEVLHLLSEGKSTAEVAAELILSVNTVRNHITHLMAKRGMRSRLEAVNVAVRRGLIRFDPHSS